MSKLDGACVVFDLDGTMVDTAPDIAESINVALRALQLSAAPTEVIIPGVSLGAAEMLKLGLAFNGVEATPERVADGVAHFLSHYEANIAVKSRPYPGLQAACISLRQSGAKLGVCTNKRFDLSIDLLKTLGLYPLFDAIAGRDTFPVSKPNPGHLLGTIERLGGDPARAIMVGDSDVDVRTANAAAIPVIAVAFGYGPLPPAADAKYQLIDTFDQLLPAIDRLL